MSPIAGASSTVWRGTADMERPTRTKNVWEPPKVLHAEPSKQPQPVPHDDDEPAEKEEIQPEDAILEVPDAHDMPGSDSDTESLLADICADLQVDALEEAARLQSEREQHLADTVPQNIAEQDIIVEADATGLEETAQKDTTHILRQVPALFIAFSHITYIRAQNSDQKISEPPAWTHDPLVPVASFGVVMFFTES